LERYCGCMLRSTSTAARYLGFGQRCQGEPCPSSPVVSRPVLSTACRRSTPCPNSRGFRATVVARPALITAQGAFTRTPVILLTTIREGKGRLAESSERPSTFQGIL